MKLPVPERDIIISSKHTDNELQARVREAPTRQLVSFRVEELEDLHRGLAYDANQTPDKKREKTIQRILRKIEEVLDDEDGDAFEMLSGFGNRLTLPSSDRAILGPGPGSATPDYPLSAASCPVLLTQSQRKLLCGMDTISLDIHKMLAVDSPEEREFKFNPRQAMVVSLALREAAELGNDDKSEQSYVEIIERVNDGLAEVLEETAELDAEQQYRQSQSSPAEFAFQLKITLEGSKPPIWRRVLVADCTLDVLHQIIQTAMGWTNSHLHMFEYGEDRFSDPRFELEEDDYDETQVWLGQLAADGCQKLKYWYDFGDDWWHTIKLEKLLRPKPTDKFPICVKGTGACPPEDCGGIWGYYDFLDAIRDPKHPRHEEFIEWAGEEFDPNRFDIEETNVALIGGPAYDLEP